MIDPHSLVHTHSQPPSVPRVRGRSAAANRGGLAKLDRLDFGNFFSDFDGNNNNGAEGIEAIADTLDKGELPLLRDLRVPQQTENFSRLFAACVNRSHSREGFLLNGAFIEDGWPAGVP